MSKIISVSDLPVSERLFLKKDLFGYRIVNPVRDPSTNKIIWVNALVGGWRNFFVLVFLLVLILLFFKGHEELTSELRLVAESPCEYCGYCSSEFSDVLVSDVELNFSGINEWGVLGSG